MRLKLFLGLVLSLFVHQAGAAELAGDTKVPFSAERTVIFNGKTYHGKIYAVPGRQRHDQDVNGLHPVVLLRADLQMAYLMLPELHIYAEFPFPKSVTEYGGVEQLGQPIGSATVAGQETRQYRVERTGSDTSVLDGSVWMTPDGIVVKIDGTYSEPGHKITKGTVELSNIVRAPQDPSLFELPPKMTKLTPEAVQALFSLRLPKLKG